MKHGFTLIELSIVLVIVGLIVAGVTAGSSLIRAAEVQKVITDVNSYKTAYNAFQLKYDAVPGDFNEANDYWSVTASGNGNQRIDITAEYYDAWQQLNLAELLGFNATGDDAGSPNFQPGVNVPAGSLDGTIFNIAYKSVLSVTLPGSNYLCLAESSDENCWNTSGTADIRVEDAVAIDKKMDDGLAVSGSVVAAGCNNGEALFDDGISYGSSNSDFAYDKGSSIKCELVFSLD